MIRPEELKTLDAAISAQLDLLRHSQRVEADVLRLIDTMRRGLTARLMDTDLTELGKRRLNALLNDANEAIKFYYLKVQDVAAPSAQTAAEVAAKQVVVGLPEVLATRVIAPAALERLVGVSLVQGSPSAAWWAKQSEDTAFKFAAAVRQGIVSGETKEQIVRRVGEVTDLAGRNARALVGTSIMQAAGDARMATITANPDIYKGYRQLSTLDGHTSELCIARSNLEWDFDLNPIGHAIKFDAPPLHWNCRSILMGILRSFAELGINLPQPTDLTRSSAEGQIARETSFEKFLSRRTEEQQNEQLGKGRAQMWRDGKITLRQLITRDGNTLTLEQLKKKYL